MGAYWASFATSALDTAVDLASDLLPVLGLLAGLGLAERVVRFAMSATRG